MLTARRVVTGAVLAVVALSLFLHFWRIGSAPPGFYADECSIAYNAHCIALTGADEYGTRWPVFFRSFDTYTDPVNVYSVALPVRVFGLQPWAARLPAGLFCLATCVAFFLLLRTWQVELWLALAGSFLLSVIPWIFPLSRNCAFAGHTAALLGLTMGLVLTDVALRKRSYGRAILAGIAWSFAFYAHQSVRPVLALLAVGSCLVLWRPLYRRWQVVLVIAASALVVLLPMIISALRFPKGFTARFEEVGISRAESSPKGLMLAVASRYLDYFNPRFLFISGDHELRHHTGHAGELYWFLAPLILVGLWVAVRYWRREPRYRLVLLGLLVSPVSAALTVDRMHSGRSVAAVFFWVLLAVIGSRALWRHKKVGRKLLVAACLVGLVEGGIYFADYFGPYQTRCRGRFAAMFTDTLAYCFDRIGSNETFYLTGSVSAPSEFSMNTELKPYVYAYVLFFGKIDPRDYRRQGFAHSVVQPYLGRIDKPGLLLRCDCRPNLPEPIRNNCIPNAEPIPAGATLLTKFTDEGPLEFQVFQVQ